MVGKLVTGLILFMKVAMFRTAQVDFELNDADIYNVGLSRCILLDYNIYVFDSNYNAVDCQWNDWTVGTCSVTCGDGMRTNTRTEKVLAAYGGEECNGPSSIQENCNIQVCPGVKPFYFLYVIQSYVFKNSI